MTQCLAMKSLSLPTRRRRGFSGPVAVLTLTTAPQPMMRTGALALLLGTADIVMASHAHSAPGFFLAAALTGFGFGAAFQGALRTVLPHVQAHERAGVLSIVFVLAYLSFGLPAIGAGVLVVHRHGDIVGTAAIFGGVVMALAALALVITARRLPTRPATTASIPPAVVAPCPQAG